MLQSRRILAQSLIVVARDPVGNNGIRITAVNEYITKSQQIQLLSQFIGDLSKIVSLSVIIADLISPQSRPYLSISAARTLSVYQIREQFLCLCSPEAYRLSVIINIEIAKALTYSPF